MPVGNNRWTYSYEGNGVHTFEISVDEVRQTYYGTLSVTANHRYRIIVSADAEDGYDGVLVTSGPHSGYEQYNNAINWSDVIACATGHNGYASETYDAPSNGTLYIVFSSDNSTLDPNPSYGSVSIYDEGVVTPSDVTITLNKNGGSGGQSSITATPGSSSWGASTLPSRSGFEFLGYFDISGDQYLDDDGDSVEEAPSSDITLYAHWKNTISYSLISNSVNVYCTEDPIVANSVLSDQTVTISNYGYDCAAGSVSYDITGPDYGYLSLEDNGETLLVEEGMRSGTTRQIIIELTSPSGGSIGNGSYVGDTMSVSFVFYLWNTHIDDYDSPEISVPSRHVTLDADGDAYTIDPSFTQTAHWNNGATSTIVSGGSFSFSVDTACSGFSLDDDEVTVTANPTSSTRGDFIVTITCTANGESSTYDVYFDQEGGTIITYGEVEITSVYTYPYFYPWGETQGPTNTITYRQAKYINGTFDSYITSGAEVTFHTYGSLPSGFSVESDFETSGEVTWDDRGTVTGGDREAKDYLYVVVELNGEATSEDCDSCYQQANTASTSTSIISYGTPDVYIGSGIFADGGEATVTCTVTNTQRTTTSYTSGSSTHSDSSVAGTAKWRITSNGNDAFTESGTDSTLSGVGTVYDSGDSIIHDDMANDDRTDTVIVTAYNVGDISKTSTAQDVTVNSLYWDNPVFSSPANNSHVSLSASGQMYVMTPSATQQRVYTSGYVSQTITLTSSDFTFAVATSKTGYSLSTNAVTVTNNTSTSARNGFRVSIKASKNSKNTTIYMYFDQPAGSQSNLDPFITGYTYSDTDASGVTDKTPTVTYEQEQGVWNGVEGSGTIVSNTGGTLSYTTTGTLPSGFSTGTNFSTSGKVNWASRGTTTGTARDAKNNLKVTVTMGGKTSSTYTCTSCKQVANAITNLTIEVGSNPISYNSTTTATVTATYTSGATLNVSNDSGTTYSTNPTGIVTVTK